MLAMRIRPRSGSTQRVFALIACLIFAQGLYASVLGTVRDESGAVLPGVSVTLTHNAMGISARTFTDENGNYQFLNVKIGSYRVEVQMASFSAAAIDNVQVTVGARQRVDFILSHSHGYMPDHPRMYPSLIISGFQVKKGARIAHTSNYVVAPTISYLSISE